ncbi:hypothetical protein AALP_AA2G250100 [Arabis alpina]|uniref:La protein 1 n=1 Tax=Arabis alpina TaxID=50452 RepID=A0A087HJU0_ARAAL|nr:hypothetical protein AALP_AA2G250100 [Arabis alpina]
MAPMASFDDETAHKLLTQVEFYFSDSNLPIDEFLNREVSKSQDGLVSLPLVCSFSRMRNLLGLGNAKRDDIPVALVQGLANLLRSSTFLKVSCNGNRIGRGTKLSKPEVVLEQVHRRTIAASPFEYNIKMDDVASFFSQYAKVNSVRLPHHVGDKKHFCGTALVEFSSEQDTEHILKQSLVYAGADLVFIPKSDFDCERENMIKKLAESGPSLNYTEFHKGKIVKFTLKRLASGGKVAEKENPKTLENKIVREEDKADTTDEKLEGNDKKKESQEKVDKADQLVVPPWDNIGSEALKDAFQRFGSVKHVEYSSGLDTGYVCFIDSDTAMKARAAVEFAGGLFLKNKFSIALEAVNGEMEREVWKRVLIAIGEVDRKGWKRLSSPEPEDGKEEDDKKERKSKGESSQLPKKAQKKH